MKHTMIIPIMFMLFIIGCEDDTSTADDLDVIYTGNMTENSYYYDLVAGTEAEAASSWHLAFQMIDVEMAGTTYSMPSLIMGNVATAVYTDISYNDLIEAPDQETLQSDAIDNSSVEYTGEHEVIHYDMATHTVTINEPERVFVIYAFATHNVYKVQFLEYQSGIIAFQFNEL
ncbi:uncharacterized protein METZ01_LOCUS13195 [marine metagenome]|uniref:Uncharacterized protein n=1 Tax=marine metagenome TaxID=408172 RepID=A0A381P0E8_9ZZZZ